MRIFIFGLLLAISYAQTDCNWVVQNRNTNGEKNIGQASSPEECIKMVKERCPGFTIANLPKTGSGSCWCQKGDDMREDSGSTWQTCLLSTITTTTTTTTTTKAPDTYVLQSGTSQKCETTGVTEHKVANRAACEAEAVDNDAPFYSYSQENTKCFYSTSCDNIKTSRKFPWKIYKRVQSDETETEVGLIRKVAILSARNRRERAQARAARGPGLRRTEDDTESELEEEQSDETAAFQILGNNQSDGITMLAIFGALTTIYYGFKTVQKMMFRTGDFQKINEDEIECYST